eukprot:1153976-Pelagomonas_calceolata.AAC.2
MLLVQNVVYVKLESARALIQFVIITDVLLHRVSVCLGVDKARKFFLAVRKGEEEFAAIHTLVYLQVFQLLVLGNGAQQGGTNGFYRLLSG